MVILIPLCDFFNGQTITYDYNDYKSNMFPFICLYDYSKKMDNLKKSSSLNKVIFHWY